MSALANILILGLEEDSDYREFLCGALIHTRMTTGIVYGFSMYFCVLFRSFLIVHANRGFVHEGKHNLTLFPQLYWVIWVAFVVVGHVVYPYSHILKGKYPEGSKRGRICLLFDIEDDEFERKKMRMVSLMFPLILALTALFLTWKVKFFLSGHCPEGRRSCIGVFKRNVISYNATLAWLMCYISFAILDVFLYEGMILYKSHLSPTSIFWIWNSKGLVAEALNLVLPFFLEIPKDCNGPAKKGDFYVKKPLVLEPRRPSGHLREENRIVLVTEFERETTESIPPPEDVTVTQQLRSECDIPANLSIPPPSHHVQTNQFYCTYYCRNHGRF